MQSLSNSLDQFHNNNSRYSLLFLESLTDSLTVLQELLSTSHDAGILAGGKLVGGKVVNAVGKALLNERRVKLLIISLVSSQTRNLVVHPITYAHKVLHLLALNELLELLLFTGVKLIHFVLVAGACIVNLWRNDAVDGEKSLFFSSCVKGTFEKFGDSGLGPAE